MSCGIDCIKWILFVFNFLWVVLGIAILAYGIFVTVSLEEPSGIQTALPGIAIGFIVLGAIIFVIAFFGCCGAVRESHCMVVTYAVFLLAILIVQLAFGIWAFVIDIDSKNENFSSDLVDPKLQRSFDSYWDSKSAKDYIDNKQATWSCCGVSGPSDYDRFQNKTIPWSCCRGSSETVQIFIPCRIDQAFKTGCNKAEVGVYNKAARITGGFSIGVAVTELVGIVFALCLANSIRNDHRRGYRV